MTAAYGIDTSVFLRLLTGHPQSDFEATRDALKSIHDADPSAQFAVSNQVIGEAYIALQFHYKISKADARAAMHQVLSNGALAPLNGRAVLDLLQEEGGAGLLDRLIAQDYAAKGIVTLTNDRRMAKIDGVRLL